MRRVIAVVGVLACTGLGSAGALADETGLPPGATPATCPAGAPAGAACFAPPPQVRMPQGTVCFRGDEGHIRCLSPETSTTPVPTGPGDGTGSAPPAGSAPGPGDPGKDGTPATGDAPSAPGAQRGGAGFERLAFARLWRITGAVLSVDASADPVSVDLDVTGVLGAPKRLADESGRLADLGATLLVGPRCPITDAHGGRIAVGDLALDAQVRVVARLLPHGRWVRDEDGQPVPTFRARRIIVDS